MLDLGIVKKDFTSLIDNIHPWMLSHFVMWLDIKVAEYKVYGHMVQDDTPNDTPRWLRGQSSQNSSMITDMTNSRDGNDSWSHSENSFSRPVYTVDEASTRQHFQSHNMPNPQQSHQIPQNNLIQRPPPTLIRQPSSYRSEETHSNQYHKNILTLDCKNGNIETIPQQDCDLENVEDQRSVQEILQNIQMSQNLQERLSEESVKSISRSDNTVMSIKDHRPEVVSDNISRSTIILGEPAKNVHESKEEKHKKSNIISVQSPKDVIKIELSSDEESQTTETAAFICDTGQEGETNSGGMMELDPKDYSIQECNLKEIDEDIYPVGLTVNPVNAQGSSKRSPVKGNSDDSISWRSKKWDYFEKLRKARTSGYVGAKVISLSLQNLLPFPDPFPLDNLQYGQRAQEMIDTGKITRSGKMQFLDTVFSEVVKYTGLYPTPKQKTDVAKAIVKTFPKLDSETNPGHGTSINSWITVLNDKYKNERRQLNHGQFYRKPIHYMCNWKRRKLNTHNHIPAFHHESEVQASQRPPAENLTTDLQIYDDGQDHAIQSLIAGEIMVDDSDIISQVKRETDDSVWLNN